jgi:hypothetical protein
MLQCTPPSTTIKNKITLCTCPNLVISFIDECLNCFHFHWAKSWCYEYMHHSTWGKTQGFVHARQVFSVQWSYIPTLYTVVLGNMSKDFFEVYT